jgi:hypothetical protein
MMSRTVWVSGRRSRNLNTPFQAEKMARCSVSLAAAAVSLGSASPPSNGDTRSEKLEGVRRSKKAPGSEPACR